LCAGISDSATLRAEESQLLAGIGFCDKIIVQLGNKGYQVKQLSRVAEP
jgi:hypothetical protein